MVHLWSYDGDQQVWRCEFCDLAVKTLKDKSKCKGRSALPDDPYLMMGVNDE